MPVQAPALYKEVIMEDLDEKLLNQEGFLKKRELTYKQALEMQRKANKHYKKMEDEAIKKAEMEKNAKMDSKKIHK